MKKKRVVVPVMPPSIKKKKENRARRGEAELAARELRAVQALVKGSEAVFERLCPGRGAVLMLQRVLFGAHHARYRLARGPRAMVVRKALAQRDAARVLFRDFVHGIPLLGATLQQPECHSVKNGRRQRL